MCVAFRSVETAERLFKYQFMATSRRERGHRLVCMQMLWQKNEVAVDKRGWSLPSQL